MKKQLKETLKAQPWLIPIYIITRPMDWFNKWLNASTTTEKMRVLAAIIITMFLLTVVWSVNNEVLWKNRKTTNSVIIIN